MRPQRGKQKLFDAAMTLFESQGYFTTTVEQITAEAGVSKGLVYNYFASKEALLVALLQDATDKMEAVAQPLTSPRPLQEALTSFIDDYIGFLTRERRFLRLQLSLLVAPQLRDTVAAPLRQRAQLLLSIVHRWFTRAGAKQAKSKARVFLALLDGTALHALFVYDAYPLATLKPQLMRAARDLCAAP